jgi:ABC-type antimicrobial peptide transport system permease subunit
VIGVIADLTIAGSIEPGRLLLPQPDPQRSVLLLSIRPEYQITKAQLNQWLDDVQPAYAVSSLLSFTQARQQLLHNDLISAVTTICLTVLVLLLALLGMYGMLSYQFQLRRHELGIRLAIGASPTQLWQQLSRMQLMSVATGAGIGLSLLWLQQLLLPMPQLLPELTAKAIIMPTALLCLLTILTCGGVLWPILRQPPALTLKGL